MTVLSIEIYLRERLPSAAADRVHSIVAAAKNLRDRGLIDNVDVLRWECSTAPAGSAESEGIPFEVVSKFETWANRTGCSLAPSFERRYVSSAYSDSTCLRLTVPVVSIAAYADDELIFVAPSADDSTHYTVDDCLSMLEHEQLLDWSKEAMRDRIPLSVEAMGIPSERQERRDEPSLLTAYRHAGFVSHGDSPFSAL